MAREDEIRLIAYDIWEEEGCPDGRDCDHWYRAVAVWEQQQRPKVEAKSVKTESRSAAKSSKASIPRKQMK